jgi:hypothetical protein
MSFYQQRIRALYPDVEPAHIEAWMRLEYGVLDGLSTDQFKGRGVRRRRDGSRTSDRERRARQELRAMSRRANRSGAQRRHVKLTCSHCGYTVRVARQWLELGWPSCPNEECVLGGIALDCADPVEMIRVGALTLDDLPRRVRTEICRRNGWTDSIVRTSPAQEPGSRHRTPKRCGQDGCGRFVRRGEIHCTNHANEGMPF